MKDRYYSLCLVFSGITLIVLLLLPNPALAQALGGLDPSFGSDGKVITDFTASFQIQARRRSSICDL